MRRKFGEKERFSAGNDRFEGFSKDLMDILSKELNFTCNILSLKSFVKECLYDTFVFLKI